MRDACVDIGEERNRITEEYSTFSLRILLGAGGDFIIERVNTIDWYIGFMGGTVGIT